MRKLMLMFGFVVLFSIGSLAQAGIIFADGFEADTVGQPASRWVDSRGWDRVDTVVSDIVHSGTKAVKINDSTSSWSRGIKTTDFSPVSAGTVEWTFYINPPSGQSSNPLIECHLVSDNGKPYATILLSYDGKVGYGSRNSWQSYTNQSFVFNDWNKFKAVVDIDANKWSLYYNDNLIVSDIPSGNPSGDPGNSVNNITFTGGSGATPVFYVDDVSLVPEPATIGLLAAGMLGFVRRR